MHYVENVQSSFIDKDRFRVPQVLGPVASVWIRHVERLVYVLSEPLDLDTHNGRPIYRI